VTDASTPRSAPGGPTPEERAATTSLGDLLTEVTGDISTLFRQEVELAKAELTQSAKKAGKGAGMFGGAGLTALFALLFLRGRKELKDVKGAPKTAETLKKIPETVKPHTGGRA